jgi:hypothetical protein
MPTVITTAAPTKMHGTCSAIKTRPAAASAPPATMGMTGSTARVNTVCAKTTRAAIFKTDGMANSIISSGLS